MYCQERDEQRVQYARALFDGIPLPAFVVDEDVVIRDFNLAAEAFLGPEPASALFRRGGEVLHCIHAAANGCGRAQRCEDCVIRNSVAQAIAGRNTWRQSHQAELREGKRSLFVDLRLTASLLPFTEQPRVLIVLELLGPDPALFLPAEKHAQAQAAAR